MSELTIKLIIILIPGAIATLIFGKLILHKEWSSFRFVLYSILFGIVSYVNTISTSSRYFNYDSEEDYMMLGFSIVIFLVITFILWKNNFYSRNK